MIERFGPRKAMQKDMGGVKPKLLSSLRSSASRSWSVNWPITVIMFFEFLIGLTDVYIAGRVSKEVQAAYGFVIQLYFIFIVIANALTVGTVSVVSRLFTSKDKDELTETVFSSIVTATIAGVVLAGAGILLGPEIIKILNIPEELKPLAISFIRIYAAGLLFHYVLISCNGLYRKYGESNLCQKPHDRCKEIFCGES